MLVCDEPRETNFRHENCFRAEDMPTMTLDLKGLQCPLPVLRANKALRQLQPSDDLRILATDRAAAKDFENFCRTTGHSLVASEEADGVLTIVIRKAG
jgi:tRNA 2-thiouridine synthesizing protein A